MLLTIDRPFGEQDDPPPKTNILLKAAINGGSRLIEGGGKTDDRINYDRLVYSIPHVAHKLLKARNDVDEM
jgi:hypothetical protein